MLTLLFIASSPEEHLEQGIVATTPANEPAVLEGDAELQPASTDREDPGKFV